MSRRKNEYIFAPETKKRRGPGCLLLVLAVVFAVVVLSLLVNTSVNRKPELRSEKISVMSLDKAYEGFAILELCDLHADALAYETDTWRSLLYGKKFSAVVLAGDMVGAEGDYVPLITLIETLRQIGGDVPIYFVAGDEDPTPIRTAMHGSPEVLADWILAAQKAGATYLDAPVKQTVGKKTVWFVPEYLYTIDVAGMLQSLQRQQQDAQAAGQQYEGEGGASYRALCYRLDATQRASDAIKEMTSADLQIGVTHVPLETDYIRTMLEWADQTVTFNFRNLSLVLAGHYVGGQWRLGTLGPLYVPDKGWLPGDEGVQGLQRVNSINQYVGGGIGASGYYPMPGRLFNSPSLSLLTFTAKIK
ncbi:MAG: hypothetical protein PHY12_02365 [Eubacteriales bacterium]|nr:hypothetical protein [Eubacteriales bacterium]